MKRIRRNPRSVSSEKCEIDLSGSKHECRLKNISADGAMVSCVGFLRETWPGDECVLHLNDEGETKACKVTHIAASLIGLKFIDNN